MDNEALQTWSWFREKLRHGKLNADDYTDQIAPFVQAFLLAEHRISKMVYFYRKIKDQLGEDTALNWFRDGAGEFLCSQAWVPYFEERKAYIVYACWYESRILGENVSLEEFGEQQCVIRFRDHLWYRMYRLTTHLRMMIEFDEYRGLFEHIWSDRAKQSGWSVTFQYEENDTVMTFTRMP